MRRIRHQNGDGLTVLRDHGRPAVADASAGVCRRQQWCRGCGPRTEEGTAGGWRPGDSIHGSKVSAAMLHGLPVFSPVDTWCSLATFLDPADLIAVVDHLLGTLDALARVAPEAFEAAIARRHAGRGTAAMRWALQRARPGARSRTETLTRVVLRSAGIPEPSLNHRIVHAGRRFYVDLAWPEVRFGLEYDGDHHRGPGQFLDDISRQELIHDDAWLLMRMTRRELFEHPEELIVRVARRLSERGWRGITLDMRHLVRPRP